MTNINNLPTLHQEVLSSQEREREIKRSYLTKVASVFARANSTLTGRRIKVNVVDTKEYPAPAWSSASEMWFNADVIKFDLSAKAILSLQGLSFHELGHLLYTPTNAHDLPIWIREQDNSQELWESFNCLEDMRIETLLTGRMPSIANWLTATIADYLMENDEAITTAFPLVYGRKYLPTEMRQLAVDNYKNPNDIAELAVIIDEYRTFVFATSDETERAKELIVAFNNLLDNLPKRTEPRTEPRDGNGEGEGGCGIGVVTKRVHNPNGHSDRPVEGIESSTIKKPKPSQIREALKKAVDKGDVSLTPKDKGDSKGDTPSTDTNSQSNSQDKSDTKAPKENETSFDDDDDLLDEFDEFDIEDYEDFDGELSDDVDDSAPTKSSRGSSDEQGTTGTNQQVTNVLNDVLDSLVDELAKDINTIAKRAGVDVSLNGGNASTPQKAHFTNTPASPELVLTANAFGRELERLRADYDPSWQKHTDNGKIDVVRWTTKQDIETSFDEWNSGRDDVTSIEAVILLDKSGSMGGHNADNAYQSMWAIKKALEKVEATTTVVLFDTDTTLLYDKDEKAGTTIRDSGANGGTDPQKAILYAKRVLAESDKAIKLLCLITDGQWNSEVGEQAVTEMKRAGVLTCQAFIDRGTPSAEYLNSIRHSFELVTQLQTAKDIVRLGKELVRLSIARNLIKR